MQYTARLLVRFDDDVSLDEINDLLQTALYDAELDGDVIYVQPDSDDDTCEDDPDWDIEEDWDDEDDEDEDDE